MQFVGLIMLVIIAIGLPLYWILEPARKAGAAEGHEERFVELGRELFAPTGQRRLQLRRLPRRHEGRRRRAAVHVTDRDR